jgi:hypothetical protein
VKRATITKKGFRLGSSHIWKYGLQYIRGSDKKEVYYCHECTAGKNKQELFVINGTSKVRNHLEQKHQIDPQSGIKKHGSTRKSVLDLARFALDLLAISPMSDECERLFSSCCLYCAVVLGENIFL